VTGLNAEPEGAPLSDQEQLARFLVSERAIYKEPPGVKAEAFDPPRDLQMSVTRHQGLSETEIWQRGHASVANRGKRLVGRADISVKAVRASGPGMDAVAAWREHNPEHAHMVGWPSLDDPVRKMVQLQLAAAAVLVRVPP